MKQIEKPGLVNRDTSIEVFRIITMLIIVAHHYVVNSGIIKEITPDNVMDIKSLFCLLFVIYVLQRSFTLSTVFIILVSYS